MYCLLFIIVFFDGGNTSGTSETLDLGSPVWIIDPWVRRLIRCRNIAQWFIINGNVSCRNYFIFPCDYHEVKIQRSCYKVVYQISVLDWCCGKRCRTTLRSLSEPSALATLLHYWTGQMNEGAALFQTGLKLVWMWPCCPVVNLTNILVSEWEINPCSQIPKSCETPSQIRGGW